MKQKFFDLARTLSKHSEHSTHKHGCVIVNKSRVISVGFNKMKTTTKSTHPYPTIHAEMDAIFKARTDLRGTTLYVYRGTKDGSPSSSKPCEHCMKVIKEAGIKKIFYSVPDGYEGDDVC